MENSDSYKFGGLDREPVNILRLISELEGSYQLLKYMGFKEDMETIDPVSYTHLTLPTILRV